MSDPLDRRGQRAAQAVRAETAGLKPDRGIDAVMRRGRRPRTITVVAAVIVLLGVSLPAIGLLRDSGSTELEFTDQPPAAPTDPDPPDPAEEADDPGDVAEPDDDAEPDDTDEVPAPAPTTTAEPDDDATEPEPTPAAEEGPSPIAGFDTEPVTGELGSGDSTIAFLTDVRVGSHDGFDRVVLEFEDGGASDFEVSYVEAPIVSAGEGAEVDIDGEAFLELRLFSATSVDFERGDPYVLTYDGPDRIAGDTSVVTEFVQTGNFEATLSWVAGVRTDAPFAVSVLEGPLRLVVDVQSQ